MKRKTSASPKKPKRRSSSWLATTPGADSDYWYGDAADFGSTLAGVPMTEKAALTLPAVFRAVANLASHLAMLPLPVFQAGENGGLERVRGHVVHRLLNESPNGEITAVAFRQSLHAHSMIWGTGYAEIGWDAAGAPERLTLLAPDRVETRRLTDRRLGHLYREENGERRVIQDEDCVRIPSLGGDGITGYGLIKHLAREDLALAKAMADYASAYFGNDTQLGVVYSTDAILKDETKKGLLTSLNLLHRGPRRAGKAAIMDGGLKPQRTVSQNDHAQLVELMTFKIQDVARWTNVPPPLLMELSHATFANITELGRWYVKYSLAPWFTVYEQEYTRKLLSPEERQTYWIEHVAEGLLRGAPKERAEFYEIMSRIGVMTANMIAGLENLPTFGPAGDQHVVQLNQTTLERLLVAPAANAEPAVAELPAEETANAAMDGALSSKELVDSYRPVLVDVFRRMENVGDRAYARYSAKQPTAEQLAEWRDRFVESHGKRVAAAVRPILFVFAGQLECGGSMLPVLTQRIIDSCADPLVRRLDAEGMADMVVAELEKMVKHGHQN